MKFVSRWKVAGALWLCVTGAAQAAVDASQAARLGQDLTPAGAEQQGNAAGTIPPWTGGFSKDHSIPAGWQTGDFYANPFAGDQPQFTIDSSNAEQYRDNLTDGQMALLKQYPNSYKLKVYPTRRTAEYPEWIYADIKANATATTLVPDGNGVVNMKTTVPFPLPQSGLEAVWNHVTRYRGKAVRIYAASAAPQVNGNYTVIKETADLIFNSEHMGTDDAKLGNIVFFYKQRTTAPPRLAGDVLLVHETLDQSREPRHAWTYSAGQRRVRRAPQVAFDTPRGADGMRTADNLDIYNGSPERYEWKLEGKKEVYIPYNNYEFALPSNRYKDILTPLHPNTDKMRYELHRVWVVTGTVKPGQKHVYAKRTFYIDEDSWQITIADQYDAKGNLWRMSEGYGVNYYDQQLYWNVGETHHDLLARRYLIATLSNEEKSPRNFDFSNNPESKLINYTPSALRRSGIR